jgi:site-specific DNA recombinase
MIAKKPSVVQFSPHPMTVDPGKYSGIAVGYVRESKLYASHAKKNQQRASKGLAQQEISIETQITSLKELAAKHNFYLPDEYIFSERHTGSDEDRPEYLRCEQFLQEIKPQAFLVHNTDRMARNFGHTLVIAQKLRKQGCQLISATQHFDSTTREGQLMITVLGWMAESERESIRERMMRGKRAKLASGQHTEQGKPKYGYRYVEGDRLRDDATSRVVLEMYNWVALEGLSAHAVTRRLNESRSIYPSPADHNGIVFQDDRPTPGWHVCTVLR